MTQTMGNRPALIATPEASPKYDDSYMGYSITVGDFAGPGVQSVAVGVPRAAELKGLVSILCNTCSENIKQISEQLIKCQNLYFSGCTIHLGITKHQEHQWFPDWCLLRLQSCRWRY